jgi:hypothetical protein
MANSQTWQYYAPSFTVQRVPTLFVYFFYTQSKNLPLDCGSFYCDKKRKEGDVVLPWFLRAFQLSICSLDSNLLFEKMLGMASKEYNVILLANKKKRAFGSSFLPWA